MNRSNGMSIRACAAALLGFASLTLPGTLSVSLLNPALCLAETKTPAETIRSVITEVQDIVVAEQTKLTEEALDTKLKAVLLPLFNFDEMSQRSLGAYWSKGTPEEQKEFVELFSDLLARTYLKRIKRNASDSKIAHISDEVTGGKAFVKSIVVSAGEEISLDYRLLQKDGVWKIYDVVIENVGLVSNYRNEFPGIIRKEGYSGLLARLRDKQATPVGIPTK